MEYEISDMGASTAIAITGRLTFDANERFREIVEAVEGKTGSAISLDLSGLEFIDSSGLGMLLLLQESAQSAGSRLLIKGVQGQVRRLLTVAHFDTLLQIQA